MVGGKYNLLGRGKDEIAKQVIISSQNLFRVKVTSKPVIMGHNSIHFPSECNFVMSVSFLQCSIGVQPYSCASHLHAYSRILFFRSNRLITARLSEDIRARIAI